MTDKPTVTTTGKYTLIAEKLLEDVIEALETAHACGDIRFRTCVLSQRASDRILTVLPRLKEMQRVKQTKTTSATIALKKLAAKYESGSTRDQYFQMLPTIVNSLLEAIDEIDHLHKRINGLDND